MGLSFTITAGFASAVTLRFESRGTHDHILLSQIRDSYKPGGPGPRMYIPQEQGGPIILPGTGFHFLRLLRLAGRRWKCSTPPPHGIAPTSSSHWTKSSLSPAYNSSARTTIENTASNSTSTVRVFIRCCRDVFASDYYTVTGLPVTSSLNKI
jgi:hypothetical protein